MRVLLILCACLLSTPALAQTVYVAGAAGVDTTLVNDFDSGFFTPADRGGTVPTFAARLGIALGERWGVELEAAHSLTLEHDADGNPGGIGPAVITNIGVIDVPEFSSQSERQLTSVNAVGWFRHPIGARVELAFLAGASFARASDEEQFGFQLQTFPPIVREQSASVVTYSVGPLVGAEAWIAFGDHVRVVPGIRLNSISGGWSVRSTAGLAWVF